MSGVPDDKEWVDVDELIAFYESWGLQGADKRVYLELRKANDSLLKKCDLARREAWDGIDRLGPDAGGITPALGGRIVDMVRAGLDEGLAIVMLESIYIRNRRYGELFGICEDILGFEGHARDLMQGSTLVESTIHQLVRHLAGGQESPQDLGRLADRCANILSRRARALGIDIAEHKEESNPLYRIDLIAMDICARRHIEPPQKIAGLLRGYSRTCAFLGLTPDKISPLAQKRTDLAYHASIAMHLRGSAPRHTRPRPNPFDILELMLHAMELRGLDLRDGRYDGWRDGLCHKKFTQTLFEMRLHLHLLAVDDNPELEPPIDNGKQADLRVGDLHIEAFAPREASSTAYGHMLFTDPHGSLVNKICGKEQACSFGQRRSIIVVEDPHDYAGDEGFLKELAEGIGERPQVGGVLLARDCGIKYACAFVKNPRAISEIPPEVEEMVVRALGAPFVRQDASP